MTNIRRGDVYYINRNFQEEGSEQYAGRPAVIVSNNANNANSSTVEVVYLTTQPKSDIPTHCTIRSTNRLSTALCEQVSTVNVDRLDSFIASVTDEEMDAINKCLRISLGLVDHTCQTSTQLAMECDFYKRRYEEILDRLIGK